MCGLEALYSDPISFRSQDAFMHVAVGAFRYRPYKAISLYMIRQNQLKADGTCEGQGRLHLVLVRNANCNNDKNDGDSYLFTEGLTSIIIES